VELTVLAASGGTGRELTRQALERGHTVTAIARTPERIGLPDSARLIRVAADAAVLAAGGTVFHAGPLNDGPLSPGRRTVGLDDCPPRLFPAGASRVTVAAAMLDEAESPRYAGLVSGPAGPLTRNRV
jgi:NAD(P)-dependent dehydrogenase (short-subunit alcohol dehydrogenase family)